MVDLSQAIGGLLGKGCLWVRLQGFKLEYRRDCRCKADKADRPSEERTTSHHGRWMLANSKHACGDSIAESSYTARD